MEPARLASSIRASRCTGSRARQSASCACWRVFRPNARKSFTPAANADWTAITRPIAEAFFHARCFLDMAVRYSTLLEPPESMPSGYAALLYLYGLR